MGVYLEKSMESNFNSHCGLRAGLRAAGRKFRVVSLKEKIKLLIKLALRPVGVKKPLFLAGYYQEQDAYQREQDERIYHKFKMNEAPKDGADVGTECASEKQQTVRTTEQSDDKSASASAEQLRTLLWERGTYLALAVQTMDKGGLEEVVRLLAVEMQHRKIPVKVFCIQSGGIIADDLRAMGIEVLCFNGNRKALMAYCRENRPMLVNTHYVLEHLDVFGELGIPVVEVIHNMYVFLNDMGVDIEKRKAPHINHYIAVSQKAKEVFCYKFPEISEAKITVIGNAFEGRNEVSRSRVEVRASLGIPQDAFVYIVVGSIDARKNQIGILRAWNIFKRITDEPAILVIVGGGTDYEYEYKVQQLLQDRSLGEDIIFTGHSNEIHNLLNAADAFVLDSYYEGWSMAATEALVCGLPLIHADCGSGAELTAGGAFGILIEHPLKNVAAYTGMELYNAMHAGVNENIEQLVGAMLDVMDKKEYWAEHRHAIREYATEHFSTADVLDKYLEVFGNIRQEGSRKQ